MHTKVGRTNGETKSPCLPRKVPKISIGWGHKPEKTFIWLLWVLKESVLVDASGKKKLVELSTKTVSWVAWLRWVASPRDGGLSVSPKMARQLCESQSMKTEQETCLSANWDFSSFKLLSNWFWINKIVDRDQYFKLSNPQGDSKYRQNDAALKAMTFWQSMYFYYRMEGELFFCSFFLNLFFLNERATQKQSKHQTHTICKFFSHCHRWNIHFVQMKDEA